MASVCARTSGLSTGRLGDRLPFDMTHEFILDEEILAIVVGQLSLQRDRRAIVLHLEELQVQRVFKILGQVFAVRVIASPEFLRDIHQQGLVPKQIRQRIHVHAALFKPSTVKRVCDNRSSSRRHD